MCEYDFFFLIRIDVESFGQKHKRRGAAGAIVTF